MALLRRFSAELLLLTLVVTWAMNIVITRWVLTHGGVQPLVYASVRYVLCGLCLAVYSRGREGPFDLFSRGRNKLLVVALAVFIVNQISFVYALKLTTASTTSLVFGVSPIVIAGIAFVAGAERVTTRFLLAAGVSVLGVGLIAVESGGGPATSVRGFAVAIMLMATWSVYTVIASSLMSTWSAYRVAAAMFLTSGIVLSCIATPQYAAQRWDVHWYVWVITLYAVGSLMVTNVLYLFAMRRVGPSQTALFANFQPFVAVLFAMAILSESLSWLEVVGGAAIAVGIGISRLERRSKDVVVLGEVPEPVTSSTS